jgi:Mn-containing catalase
MPVDGGDGTATVELGKADESTAKKLMLRTQSDPTADPQTGVDLGAGPGAGMITGGQDMGAAEDVNDAAAQAKARSTVDAL